MLVLKDAFARWVMRITLAICLAITTVSFAQTDNSQKVQVATAVASKDFSGNWKLNEEDAKTSQRVKAIEDATASLGRFKQRRAFDVMQKMTAPAKQLEIVDQGKQVQITQAGQKIIVGTDGKQVNSNGPNGKLTLKAEKREGKLIIEVKSTKATRTVVYELSDDGTQLNQQVEIVASQLPKPVRFANSYRR